MAEALKGNPLSDEPIGDEDAELLRIARERYQRGIDADQDNREKGVEDLEFLAGEQWPTTIYQERDNDNRPILTINRMPQFVRQVTGDIRQNHPAIKVRPADDKADKDIADIYTGLVRHIEAQSDAGVAYETAADGGAQCGIGHFRIVTEYSDDDTFDQDIRVKRICDHFSVTWDPHAKEPTRSDARYCFVEESLDINTFKARYPNASTTGFNFQDKSNTHLNDWFSKEAVRVAEYWTKTPEKRLLALLEDGRTIDITNMPDKDGIYIGVDGAPLPAVVRTREVMRDKVEMRLINGAEVLEKPFTWLGRDIPIIPVLGEEIFIQTKTVRFGVIRNAKDPQRMYNYWRSAQTEQIALQPKAPFLVTATNITGYENIWQEANTRNHPYLPYKPDKDNKGAVPQRQAPQMASGGMHQEVLLAAEDMKATTGIYDAGLGAKSNEKSGIAIRERKEESDTSTYVYADNLTRALRYAGRQLVELIPKVYDNERQVRVLNEDETSDTVTINQTVILEDGSEAKINDISLGKYDVLVTTGPSYGTKRAEAADGILKLVQAVPDTGKLILDILARNLDWPGAEEIAERFRKTLPPGLLEPEEGEEGEDPPEPVEPTPEEMAAQATTEAEQRKEEREDAKTAAEIAETQADTEGKELDNAAKAIELAMQSGQMQTLIMQQVETVLERMFAPEQTPAPALGVDPLAPQQ